MTIGKVKVLAFSEGTVVTAPGTAPNVAASGLATYANDAAFVTAKGSAAAEGDVYWNTTLHQERGYNGTAWVTVLNADTNNNLAVDNLIEGYATTATAAGTTTLTVDDKFQQYFTGVTTQTVVLPVVSTLVLGQQFQIINLSSGVVTVQSSGANSVQAIAASSQATLTCVLVTGTSAASWSVNYSPLQPGASLTNPMTTAGDVIVGGVAGAPARLAIGASGTVLKGGTTPAWATIVNADVDAAAAIAGTKLVAAASGVAGAVSTGAQTFTGIKTLETQGIIHGTGTNDDAAAGYVGEILTQTTARSAGLSLVTNTGKSINTITLTPGDWDVSSMMGFLTGGSTSITMLEVGHCNTTNSTAAGDTFALPDATGQVRSRITATAFVNGGDDYVLSIPTYRVKVATATTVVLWHVALATFTVSTLKAYGFIMARRVR